MSPCGMPVASVKLTTGVQRACASANVRAGEIIFAVIAASWVRCRMRCRILYQRLYITEKKTRAVAWDDSCVISGDIPVRKSIDVRFYRRVVSVADN